MGDLLLEELRAPLDIPADEAGFGNATRKAVVALRERERLDATRIVDPGFAGEAQKPNRLSRLIDG